MEQVDEVGRTRERQWILERTRRNASGGEEERRLDAWERPDGDCSDSSLDLVGELVAQERKGKVSLFLFGPVLNFVLFGVVGAVLLDEGLRIAVGLQCINEKSTFFLQLVWSANSPGSVK